jgi:hypothetical protein
MSIKDMCQRLAGGETIQAVNPDNDLQFDVEPYPIAPEGYQSYNIYVNGKHVNSACVPADAIEEWASGINERQK